MTLSRRCLLHAATALALPATAQQASPHAIDIPRWFSLSLLDFKDEVPEAARAGKRLMIYFGQDGCPYCKALMKSHFAPGPIADKTRAHFVAVAVNIWGDTETTWTDGRRFTEKTLARELKVQFTPTLVFLETDGSLALRIDGYHPAPRFAAMLDYVVERRQRNEALADYLDARDPSPLLHPPKAPYLVSDPSALSRRERRRPLAVLFESDKCASCSEMHKEAFVRPGMRALLPKFDVARLVPAAGRRVTTPDGRALELREWARELRIQVYPTAVFFDADGREAFRFDGYLRPFHIESAFDYVASGSYRSEPQFQRFVQARAERLEAQGRKVDLWK